MLLDDVLDLLSSGLPTLVQGTNLFAALAPAEGPDRLTLVSETGGVAPIHTMSCQAGNAQIIERPRVQVWCRGVPEGYQGARQDAENIYHVLNGVRDRTINGVHYLWITAVQTPFSIPPDMSLRPAVACNYDVVKSLTTSTST